MAVMAMCAIIGTEYIQALIPALAGPLNAKLIGTGMVLIFLGISCKGVNATAKVASVFLIFEISVVAGLGLMGIINPQVPDLSVISMYTLEGSGGWSAIGPGVLFGVWMLANFDSAINYIEESRVPVRTIQRSMLLVLTSAFVIYTLAAIGWQYAVPVEKLAAIIEDGNGGPIAAVANVYLPPAMAWIALFVVITSACAGLQISSSAAARTLYRMSEEGHLPTALCAVNKTKSPWLASVIVSSVAIALLWWKPLDKIVWYYDVVTITLVMSYMAAIAAFIVMTFRRQRFGIALALSIPASLAILVLGYIGYTAGANPVSPEDQYTAWYLGALTILSGAMILVWQSRYSRQPILSKVQES
jgi:amino acid transporter